MGLLDFPRYDKILLAMDEKGVSVRTGNITDLRIYFEVIRALYMNLRPMAFETAKKEIDQFFDDVDNEIFKLERVVKGGGYLDIPRALQKQLLALHNRVLDLRQDEGLGPPTKKITAPGKKIRKALSGE